MTTNHTRAEQLAAESIPLLDWDPVNEEPVETYGYPETERLGFVKGYLAAIEEACG